MGPLAGAARRWRFWILERAVLPLAMPLLRLMMGTWRSSGPDAATLSELMAAPRVVLVTFHGMLLQLLRYRGLPSAYGRRMVVMLSPSLDGRLLAAALRYFDIDHVYGTPGRRAVAGTREFVRRVQSGDIGVIAADGPVGPRCIVKPGFRQIAAAAGAHVGLVVTSADRGLTFGSWDGAQLPSPFAHVALSLQVISPHALRQPGSLAEAQEALLAAARALHSCVLPGELRGAPLKRRAR